jgi:UDP-N-acetylmuramoylalanine--D-glutamate ligase
MDGDFSVQGRRVVVLGAARSGIAAAELLVRRGARVTLSETRTSFEGMDRLRGAGVQLETGGHTLATLGAADLIVVSPGVPLEQPAVESARRAGIEIIGELELASRWLRGPGVGGGGRLGKSTKTNLKVRID